MTPVVPPGANLVLQAPSNWDVEANGPCEDLHVIKRSELIISVWKPTMEELKMLNEGGFVMLTVHSNDFPPTSLSTCMITATKEDAPR
jgi:hypothetical protein